MSVAKFNKWQDINGNLRTTILQTKYVHKPSTWSAATTGNNFYDVTGLTINITPTFSNSLFLLQCVLYTGVSSYQAKFRYTRNSTAIISGDPEGSRPVSSGTIIMYDDINSTERYRMFPMIGNHIDVPNTVNPLTYQIQMASYDGQTVYLNRSYNWQNSPANGYDAVPVSSFVVMEIAQ